jgi:hypothetical protein
MDILVKGCTVIMILILVTSTISEIRKDCNRSQLFSLFTVSLLLGLPFGRVWGLW